MPKLLLFLLCLSFGYGAKLLDINTYTNTNYTDLKISLDAPYTQKVVLSKDGEDHLILLSGVEVARAKEVAKESKRYKFIRIFPERSGLLFKIREKEQPLTIDISKSEDRYTLRIRITASSKYQLGNYKVEQAQVGEDVPNLDRNYLISIGFVALLLLIWILVKLLSKSKSGKNFFIKSGKTSLKIEVEVQKVIDNQNKIVQIKLANMNYIVLVGQTNTLLDKFPDPSSSAKKNISKFDTNLEKSHKRFNSLLR